MSNKTILQRVFRAITDKRYRFNFFVSHGFYKNMPDDEFLKKLYKLWFERDLDLENPKTFNEKTQWLKLYDRRPEYTEMVDKFSAKEYVSRRIGEEYIIPTFGVWDRFEDIDFDKLPQQFVLKCTHDSGGIVIVKDKDKLNKKAAKAKIEKCLKRNFYDLGREWPYKNVKPRIIAEQYMEDAKMHELRDYKFFCFNGTPKLLLLASERQSKQEEMKVDFFDMDYKHLPIKKGHPNAPSLPEKPATFEEMKTLAAKLSAGVPLLRVDFYEANGKCYFGELTFSSGNGIGAFEPEEWDYTLGEWITLPPKKSDIK